MPKMTVKYKLNADGTIPMWIEDGGYFCTEHEKIGVTVDTDEFYVPAGLEELSDQDLKNLVKGTSMKKDVDGVEVDMTDTEKDEIADKFLTKKVKKVKKAKKVK